MITSLFLCLKDKANGVTFICVDCKWICFCDGSIMNPAKATVLLVFLSNNVKSLHGHLILGIANQMIGWVGDITKRDQNYQ